MQSNLPRARCVVVSLPSEVTSKTFSYQENLVYIIDDSPQTDVGDSKLVSPHVSFNDCSKKDLVYIDDYSPQNNISKPNAEKILDNMSSSTQSLRLSGEDQNQNPPNLITKIEASNLTQKGEVQIQNQNNNKIRPANHCSVMHSSCTIKVSLHSGQSCQNNMVNSENIPDDSKETKQVSKPSQVRTTGRRDKKGEKEKTLKKKGNDPYECFEVNRKLYTKLDKICSGGSSVMYKVISIDFTVYSLKKIKLKGRNYPTAIGFCQEIEYLNRLKGKRNIIQLIDYEITDKSLYMVLEFGEIDLAHMVSQKWSESNKSTMCIDENWLRFYWKQMLDAVNTIHEERIVHSDLKPANFVLVRGTLKLIDFGIAKAIMNDTTNIERDSQVGTLNYMSPEAFQCNEEDSYGNTIKCGRPSDIWSLGCIFYQMVYGKTPFADYNTFWAKYKVITNKNHQISYPPVPNHWLIDLMKRCLAWDHNNRWSISQLLVHPFLVPPVIPVQVANSSLVSVPEKIRLYRNHSDVAKLFSQLGEVISKIEETSKSKCCAKCRYQAENVEATNEEVGQAIHSWTPVDWYR